MAKTETKVKEVIFTKQQLLDSKTFREDRDLVQAIVKDDECITIDELATRIKKWKGKVIK